MFGKGRRSLLNPLQITGVIPLESWVWPPLSCCGGVRTQDRNKRINDLVMGIALLTWPKFAWIDWSTTCWIAFPALNVMGIWSHKLLSINFHVKWEGLSSHLLPPTVLLSSLYLSQSWQYFPCSQNPHAHRQTTMMIHWQFALLPTNRPRRGMSAWRWNRQQRQRRTI